MKICFVILGFFLIASQSAYGDSLSDSGNEKTNYPQVNCPPNSMTVAWVQHVQPRVYAEIGIAVGGTVCEIARVLPAKSEIYLFDYYDKVANVKQALLKQGYSAVRGYGNSYKLRDSYNWSLMKLLKEHEQPIFDYVYIDGMHTWEMDGFAFLLIDKLLKPGGFIDFDDYDWTLRKSPTLNPTLFPLTSKLYTEEQIDIPGIKLVVDLLVRRNSNYIEVVKDKIFQKKIN
jgi:predicted O-methyltransferase YrrM